MEAHRILHENAKIFIKNEDIMRNEGMTSFSHAVKCPKSIYTCDDLNLKHFKVSFMLEISF